MDAATRRGKQRENQNYFSSKISELTRYVNFGIAAACFAIITRPISTYSVDFSDKNDQLLWAIIIASVALFLDYLQFFLGNLSSSIAANDEKNEYKTVGIANAMRQIQNLAFYLKQGVTVYAIWVFTNSIFAAIS